MQRGLQRSRLIGAVVGLVVVAVAAAGCSDDDAGSDTDFVNDIDAAVQAVEAELGPGQQFFEVTATAQLTNVFVATDGATAAIPYVYLDGELGPPAPSLAASGHTFAAEQIDIDEEAILSQVVEEVPDATIESLSVEGGDDSVRYVVAVRSPAGGVLDVTVSPDGAVLEVDPV